MEILKDLRDLAQKQEQGQAFQTRLGQLTARHSTKRAFLERLRKAKVE